MEELSQQMGGGGGNFLYLPSSTAMSPLVAEASYGRAGDHDHDHYPHHAYVQPPPPSQGELPAAEDGMKAKIMSHPQCSTLIAAFIDCQKEAYCDILAKYRDELSRPLQEATEFLNSEESQLTAFAAASSFSSSSRLFSYSDAEEKEEDAASSEEDLDPSSRDADLLTIDLHADDKELKLHLLKKYRGYLSSLQQELSKKKKKGKLPKEARHKLLEWWELHNKWPYPSESEKVALVESTSLDQKQINNWFINQRKRHWKPSEDMQFMVCMEGQFMGGDGLHRLGP